MKFRKKNLVESPSPTKTDSSNSPSSDSSSPRHATSTSSRRHRLMRLPRRRPKPEEPIQQLPSAHSLQTSLHNTTTKTLIDNTDSPTAAAADGPDNHDDDPQQPPQRELVRTGSFKTIHPSRLSQYYNDDHAGHTTSGTNLQQEQDETKASIHPDRRLERQLEHRFLSSEERMSDGKEIANTREHPSVDEDHEDVLDTTSNIEKHKTDDSIHMMKTTTSVTASSADNITLKNKSLHPSTRSPEENDSIEKEEALLLETNPLGSNDSTKNNIGTPIEKEAAVWKEEATPGTNVDKAAKTNNGETRPSFAAEESSHDEESPTETTGPLHASPTTTTTSPSTGDSSIGIVEASEEAVSKIKPARDVQEMESAVMDEMEPTSPPSPPLHEEQTAPNDEARVDKDERDFSEVRPVREVEGVESGLIDDTSERDSSGTKPVAEESESGLVDEKTAPNVVVIERSDEKQERDSSKTRPAHEAEEMENGLVDEEVAPNDVAEVSGEKEERNSIEVHEAEKVESGSVEDNRERGSIGTRPVAEESESGLIDEKTATSAIDTSDEKRERDSIKSIPAHETEEMGNGLVIQEAAPNKEIGTSAEKEERNFNEVHEVGKVESGGIDDGIAGDPIGTKPVRVAKEWENGLIDEKTAPNVAAIETSDEKRERDSSKTRPAREDEEIENGFVDEKTARSDDVVEASADKEERDSSEGHEAEKVESLLLDGNGRRDPSETRPAHATEESESGLIEEKAAPSVLVDASDEKQDTDSSKSRPTREADEMENGLVDEEVAPNDVVEAIADKKERDSNESHDAAKVESLLFDENTRRDTSETRPDHVAKESESGLVHEKAAPIVLVDASDEKQERESNKRSSTDEAEETASNEAVETSDEKRRRDSSEVRPLHEAEEVGNLSIGVETGWEISGARPTHDAEESASGLIDENTTPNVAVESSDEENERGSGKVTRARVAEEERGRDSSGTRPAPEVEEAVSRLIDDEAAQNAVVGAMDSRGTEADHEAEEVESGSTDDEAAPNAAVETNDEHRRNGNSEWSLGHDAEQREWGFTGDETAPNTAIGKNDEKKENNFGKRRPAQNAEEPVMLVDEKTARNEAAEMTDEKRQRDYSEARTIFEAKKNDSELIDDDMAAKAVVETVYGNSWKDPSETRPKSGSKSSETSPAQEEAEESVIGSVDELELDANDKKNATESNETRPAHDIEEFESVLTSQETTVVGEENGNYPSEVRQTDEAEESDRGLIVEEPAPKAVANDEESGRNPPYDFVHDFVQTKMSIIKAGGRGIEKPETAVATSEKRTADHSTFGRRSGPRAVVHEEEGAALGVLQQHATGNHSKQIHSDDLDLPDAVVQNRMEMHESNERKPVAEPAGNVDKSVFMMKGTDRWEISANPASRIAANLTYQEMRFLGRSTHKSSAHAVSSADGLDLELDETSKSNEKEFNATTYNVAHKRFAVGGASGLETAVLSLEDGSEISDITSIRSKEIHASTTDLKLSWKEATDDTDLAKVREAPKIEASHGNVDPRRDQDETNLPVPQKLKLDHRQLQERINDGFEHSNNEAVTGKQQFIHSPLQVDNPHLYVDQFWQEGGHARSRRNRSEMVIRRLHLSPKPEVAAGERTSELPIDQLGNAAKGEQSKLEAGRSGNQSRERINDRHERRSNEAVTEKKHFIHSPLQVEHPHLTVDPFWREDGHTRASRRNSSEMVIRQFHLSPRPVAVTEQPIPGLQKSQSGDIAEGEQLQSEGDMSGKGRREGNKRERDRSNQAPQKKFGFPSTVPFGDDYKGRRGIVAESGYSQSFLPQEDKARPKTDQKRSPYHDIWMDDMPSQVSVYRNKPVETLRDLMSPLGLSNLYHLVRHRTSVSKRTAMFLRSAPDPFWKGVDYRLYQAHMAKDVDQLGAEESNVHLKSLHSISGSQPYFEQMECSEVANFLAEMYNMSPHRPSHCAKIYILQSSVVEVAERRDGTTKCFFLAERPLPSEDPVTKYCDDAGHWTPQPDESLVRFSAFTFNITKKYLMAAHFQGIRIANRFILVDPAILCEDSERFGSLNPGRAAMTRSIESTFSILKKNGWKI